MSNLRLRSYAALAALPLLCLTFAGQARAAIGVVTPGEQNTASGENGCAAAPCNPGHWLHYPQLLQISLGAGYTVQDDGDGGAVLGCDVTPATLGGSFCKSGQYTNSLKAPTPGIAIIGPFGEHDQRIILNNASLYSAATFEAAYEGLVQAYLKVNAKVYMMTPIDVPWGGTNDLPNNEHLVKDIMVPAALKIAGNHQITVIDTYTAISGTPALVTQYYATDGQVNAAGQLKMAELIEAALKGGTGGAGGAGGTSGTAGAAGAAGGSAAGAAGSATAGAGGTGGAVGSGGASVGAAGTTVTAAGGSSAVGSAGSSATAGSGTTTPIASPAPDSGGCSIGASGSNGWNAGILLAMAGLVGLKLRRRASKK